MKYEYHKLLVTVRVPASTEDSEVRAYVKEAVAGWGGGNHPEDPFFLLMPSDVAVRHAPKGKAKK